MNAAENNQFVPGFPQRLQPIHKFTANRMHGGGDGQVA